MKIVFMVSKWHPVKLATLHQQLLWSILIYIYNSKNDSISSHITLISTYNRTNTFSQTLGMHTLNKLGILRSKLNLRSDISTHYPKIGGTSISKLVSISTIKHINSKLETKIYNLYIIMAQMIYKINSTKNQFSKR